MYFISPSAWLIDYAPTVSKLLLMNNITSDYRNCVICWSFLQDDTEWMVYFIICGIGTIWDDRLGLISNIYHFILKQHFPYSCVYLTATLITCTLYHVARWICCKKDEYQLSAWFIPWSPRRQGDLFMKMH